MILTKEEEAKETEALQEWYEIVIEEVLKYLPLINPTHYSHTDHDNDYRGFHIFTFALQENDYENMTYGEVDKRMKLIINALHDEQQPHPLYYVRFGEIILIMPYEA